MVKEKVEEFRSNPLYEAMLLQLINEPKRIKELNAVAYNLLQEYLKKRGCQQFTQELMDSVYNILQKEGKKTYKGYVPKRMKIAREENFGIDSKLKASGDV